MHKIKDTRDNTGEHVEIWFSPGIAGSPAMSLFLKTYAESIDTGLALPAFLFKNEDRIIWAQRTDGKILGGISYEYLEYKKSGWTVWSFTAPEERGKGIYQLVHESFEEDCRKLGAVCIESMTHKDNKNRLAAAAKVGMLPKYIRLYKDL
jgi:GNAT superfamily N-acetyltransferase